MQNIVTPGGVEIWWDKNEKNFGFHGMIGTSGTKMEKFYLISQSCNYRCRKACSRRIFWNMESLTHLTHLTQFLQLLAEWKFGGTKMEKFYLISQSCT